MASRRDFKKNINQAMDILYLECVFYKVYVKDANVEKANQVIQQISDVQADFLSRLSTSEGKSLKARTSAYYKKMRADLIERVDALSKEIEDLNK